MTDQGDSIFGILPRRLCSVVFGHNKLEYLNVKTQLKGSSLLKTRSVASIYARAYSKNMQKEVYFYLLKAFLSQSQDHD